MSTQYNSSSRKMPKVGFLGGKTCGYLWQQNYEDTGNQLVRQMATVQPEFLKRETRWAHDFCWYPNSSKKEVSNWEELWNSGHWNLDIHMFIWLDTFRSTCFLESHSFTKLRTMFRCIKKKICLKKITYHIHHSRTLPASLTPLP